MQHKTHIKLLLILLGVTIISYSSGSHAAIDSYFTKLENNLYSFYSLDARIEKQEANKLATYLRANRIAQLTIVRGGCDANCRGIFPAIIKALANRERGVLTELTFTHNPRYDILLHLNTAEVQALADALRENRTLTTLGIEYYNIGGGDVQALADALRGNRTLTTLNLRGNDLGNTGAQALAAALWDNRTLTTLNLRANRLGDAGVQALADALRVNRTLTTLNLRTNPLGAAGAQALAAALRENRTLTTLDLNGSNLGDTGVQALADALRENRTLTTLEVENNTLRATAGIQALAAALRENQTLTTLSIRECNLGTTEVQALADAVRDNRALTTLNFQYNFQNANIGDAGAQALAAALRENRTLTTLNLNGNKLGDAGVQALADALRENRTLTTLEFENNTLRTTAGTQALALVLAHHNFTLREMHPNFIYDDLIRLALERNRLLAELAPTVAASRRHTLIRLLGNIRIGGNNTLPPELAAGVIGFYDFTEDNNMRFRRLMHDTLIGLTEQEQLLVKELRVRQQDIIRLLLRMGHPLPDPEFIPVPVPAPVPVLEQAPVRDLYEYKPNREYGYDPGYESGSD